MPSSAPAEAGFYTVVAQATVNKPAVPNLANDLKLDLIDYTTAGEATTPIEPIGL